MFHALTGCDQTSFFAGRGKLTAWETWNVYNEVTEAFYDLSCKPSLELIEHYSPQIERFIVLIYDRASESENVNDARKYLFTQKGRSMDAIPPTQSSLLCHVKRSCLQGGHIWGQALSRQISLPHPNDWGWTKDKEESQWKPVWSLLPEAAKACQQLIKCGCDPQKGCKGRCKCRKAQMKCTAMCKCVGDCEAV